MADFVEFKDKTAFHPGYYIREIIENSGLTQEDFAKRLDTTPKNLSLLIRGEQNLSVEMAMKLSRMLGTSVEMWQNLQNQYDALTAEFVFEQEFIREKEIIRAVGYNYFRDYCSLPALKGKIGEQVCEVRRFLNVSTLSVFTRQNMTVSFRNAGKSMTEAGIIKSNMIVQIAVNQALKTDAPAYDRKAFLSAVQYALSLTERHDDFLPLVKEAFRKAGVILVILPAFPGSGVYGASKKIRKSVLMMVTDRYRSSDVFWFTLMHEASHVLNNEFGISFEKERSEIERAADRMAASLLIPEELYESFVQKRCFTSEAIRDFAASAGRDPGIILGRLQHDSYVRPGALQNLKHQYDFSTLISRD